MDLGLNGVRVLVTGASKGLGKACARTFVEEGALVFICARNAAETQRTAEEVGASGWAAIDVSKGESVGKLVADAINHLGGLDVLIANAGGPPTGPFETAGDEDWDVANQLTLMSAVRLIRESIPALKVSGRGRILNLTGYGVKEPMTDLCVSDAVRAAVTVMAKTIATDLAPYGITVNNVAPGPILTDRFKEVHAARAEHAGISVEEQFARFTRTIPVNRLGDPEEVAALCAFLASRHSGYITGQSIVIDGGINRSI
ncbi:MULTISPECIES: SDR family oxidoreductase [Paraburkholderia]|uniref:SDR family oxidoreductase n=1 Tax=Paraburkholderia metrosideri TaxID=580937 RepID=A0ABW9E312_9BURK